MQDLRERVAVVTGGGSGIGRGIAQMLAEAGAHVVVADVDLGAAESVANDLATSGARTLAVETDVSEPDSLEALAAQVDHAFGAVHLLCNNAGVIVLGALDQTSLDDWAWMTAVNLMGVVHGVNAFLPRFRAQGGEAHIVNTASIAGLTPTSGQGAYSATKYAVVGYSEMLARELADSPVGVSVLCPGGVNTRIADAGRNRQARFGPDAGSTLDMSAYMDPEGVGRIVVAGIRDERLYILTHPRSRARVEQRFEAILAEYQAPALVDRT